jgi:D-3-phosphoglycerate dehydrogenase
MYNVLILDPIAPEGVALLKDHHCNVRFLQDKSLENIKQNMVDVDAILVRTTKITAEIINAGPKLKVISRHGVGVDNIDVATATKRGVYVTNTPLANTVSVAEHLIGMMIVLARQIRKADLALRDGRFEARNEYIGVELEGKTLGIIGLGKIGQKVGRIAALGLGMKVIGYDPYIKPEQLDGMITLTTNWDQVFRNSDFVSVHLPLLDSTRGIIGMNEFQMMKRSAYFINGARGAVVKEADLIRTLQDGVISGAGLDVYEQEPPLKDNPLFAMENTVVTPHMAAHSHDAMVKMATHAAQGIIEVLQGHQPSWPMNILKD